MSVDKELNILERIKDISKNDFSILQDKDKMARYMKIKLLDTDEGESLTLGNLIEGALKLAKRDHNIHRLMKQDMKTAGMYFLGVLSVHAKLYVKRDPETDERFFSYIHAYKAKTNEEIDFVRDNFILGQISDISDDEILNGDEIFNLINS